MNWSEASVCVSTAQYVAGSIALLGYNARQVECKTVTWRGGVIGLNTIM